MPLKEIDSHSSFDGDDVYSMHPTQLICLALEKYVERDGDRARSKGRERARARERGGKGSDSLVKRQTRGRNRSNAVCFKTHAHTSDVRCRVCLGNIPQGKIIIAKVEINITP